MVKIILCLISVVLLILDNSLLPSFSIYGAYPSLLFTFAITYSLLKKKNDALFIGILSGVLQDVYFFNGFGINCFINMLLCIAASAIGDSIVKNKRIIPVVSMFFITMIKFAALFIILYFIDMSFGLGVVRMIIISVENAIITFIIYNYLSRKIEENGSDQQWRFR